MKNGRRPDNTEDNDMSECRTPNALPVHPLTGAVALGFTRRGPIWPILGGAPDDPPTPPADPPNPPPAYTPPATQADLNRIIEDRLGREKAKYADYDTLKATAAKHEALLAEMGTDQEKATKKAADEARAEVMAEAVPRVVKAEFRAAAKGVLAKEQLDALLEDLDLSRYANADGEPDEDKIAKKVAALAPPKKTGTTYQSLGQGNHNGVNPTAKELGRAEAEKRFPKIKA